MKNIRCLIVALALLLIAFCSKANAQDFGVKGSTPTVFLIGGGFQIQLDNLNWGDLPIENNVKDYTGGVGIHVKGEIRKYFGTSGFYVCPNLKMSIGLTTRNNREIEHKMFAYYCFNSNIIPAIGLGYDLNEYWGLHLGVGYWAEFVFGPKFYKGKDLSSVETFGITKETNSSGKIAVIVGAKSDELGFDADFDFVIGLGNPFKTVDAIYDAYHFQLNSPFLLFTISLNKKFQKY